ncbi:hypothetical protein CAC42_6616 [Sphaceloma murrayae]|uniref:Hyaluronan/mRNA-binding protein domain-containing protein n=1 Tax=Sphaceloma murrayae TaxID=2082308 RepID=A0A2K1QGX4_9PEZI|nr:hypothetical protein CAC42_6616 [Sphaceloma murrayae]
MEARRTPAETRGSREKKQKQKKKKKKKKYKDADSRDLQALGHEPSAVQGVEDLTRSHKANDRDHAGLVNGTAGPEEHLPRYFSKNGYVDNDPKSTKKKGSGKGNWGKQGDELEDYDYNLTKPRRRSNSFSAAAGHNTFKTKFEAVEPEPVFEEDIHGPEVDDLALEEQSTHSSAGSGSVEDEEAAVDKK